MTRAKAVTVALIVLLATLVLAAAPARGVGSSCVDADNAAAAPAVADWANAGVDGAARTMVGSSSYGATAYEWWGTGGLRFTTSNAVDDRYQSAETEANCAWEKGITRNIAGIQGSTLWAPLASIADGALSLAAYAQSLSILPLLTEKVIVPVTVGGDTTSGLFTVFKYGSIIAFVLTLMWAAWQVLRGRAKTAYTGIGWSALIVTLGLTVLASPTFLPGMVGWALNQGQTVAAETAMDVTEAVSSDSQVSRLCTLDDTVGQTTVIEVDGHTVNLPSRGVREAVCSVWATVVYTPWAAAQFGTSSEPVAETYVDADGTPDPTRWDAAKQNATIAAAIPGLATQPTPGSLPALQQSAVTLNAVEQAWKDAYIAAGDPATRADRARQADNRLSGQAAIAGGPHENDPAYAYPTVTELAAATPEADQAALAAGVNTLGHAQRWQLLRDRVNETTQTGVSGTWSGASTEAFDARNSAALSLGWGLLLMVVPMTVFTVAVAWYQLALALMLAGLGLVLIAAAFPRYGFQVVRDYTNKLLKYVIMTALTLFFLAITPIAAVGIPNMLLPTPTGGAGMLLYQVVSFLCVGALVAAWWKASKGFGRRTLVRGANEGTMWDLAGQAQQRAQDTAVTAAYGAGAVTAAAVTGGVSVAAATGAAVAAEAATHGHTAARRTATTTVQETVTRRTPAPGPVTQPVPEPPADEDVWPDTQAALPTLPSTRPPVTETRPTVGDLFDSDPDRA